MEPSYKQFNILEDIRDSGFKDKLNSDEDIDEYWKLVRAGYLRNLCSVGVMWDWRFELTEKGKKYLAV